MELSVENELGSCAVSNDVFAEIITYAMEKPDTNGKVWPARNGKTLGAGLLIPGSSLPANIDVEADENGDITIEFSLIVRFGASIKRLTKLVADSVSEETVSVTGLRMKKIVINIAGVRSKRIAKRNTRVVFDYESE